ncbi:MAG: hypothetical protein LBR53_11980 [Deltaproteobacteria bacterium]|nr:hypothetical protein [Deltaproteobacteria bacterium]
MKKFFFIILLFIMAFVSGIALLAVAWYFQWSPAVALLGPLVFLVFPLLWWIATSLYASFTRRALARRVAVTERESEREDVLVSLLERDWRRGLSALENAAGPKESDLAADGHWFLFLEPNADSSGTFLGKSGAVTDFLNAGDGEEGSRVGPGFNWYVSGGNVFLEPYGFLKSAASAPPRTFSSAPVGAAVPALGQEEGEGAGMSLRPLAGFRPGGGSPSAKGGSSGVGGASSGAGTEYREMADWELFAGLLVKTGRKIPLNGIVLLTPGELLRREREGDLLNLSVRERKCLDILMRITDASAPVYLLVTELEGFAGLRDAVRGIEADSPAGVLIDPQELGGAPLKTTEVLGRRMRNLLVDDLDSPPEKLARLLLAPASLHRLERPLSVYLSGLSRQSPYAPPPQTRGIFLTAAASGPELGAPEPGFTRFLNETLGENASLAKRLNLPGGRGRKRLALFCLVFYLILGVLGFLFYKNVSFHRDVSAVSVSVRGSAGTLSGSGAGPRNALFQANALNFFLGELDKARARHKVRGLGSDRADRFISEVEGDFITSADVLVDELIGSLDLQLRSIPNGDSLEYSMTLRQILWLLSVFNARERGEDYLSLAGGFPLLPEDFQGPSTSYWDLGFCRVLMEYLRRDDRLVRPYHPLSRLRESLSLAAGVNSGSSMDWITRWARNLPELQSVPLNEFWPRMDNLARMAPYIPEGASTEVPGVYTLKGRNAVMSALDELREVYGAEKSGLDSSFSAYQESYEREYVKNWTSFYESFKSVAANVRSAQSAADLAAEREAGGFQPYERFLQVFTDNLAPYLNEDQEDLFFKNAELDLGVGIWARSRAELSKASRLPAFKRLGSYGEVMESLRGSFKDVYYRTDFVGRVYQAETYYSAFIKAQNEIVDLLNGPAEKRLGLAGLFYGGGQAAPAGAPDSSGGKAAGSAAPGAAPAPGPGTPSTGAGSAGTAFAAARAALEGYESSVYKHPDGSSAEDVFLTTGRIALKRMETLLIESAAASLNTFWESEVYMPVMYHGQDEAEALLYGPAGLVMKFVNGPAAPFLERKGLAGFVPRSWNGTPFPFSSDFLSIAALGASENAVQPFKESYEVKLTVTGAVVDPGAKEKPEKTTVYLKSGNEAQALENYNFPVSKTFVWKPAGGGETGVEIDFPSLSLSIRYDTENGFPTFLNEIAGDGFVFTPADFPDHRDQLEAMGVTRVTLAAEAEGAYPVINFLSLSRTALPRSIVKAP